MPDKLKRLLDSLALPTPARVTNHEDGSTIAEWDTREYGDYYEIELDGDDDLSIMSKVGDVIKHWEVIETCPK